MMSARISVETDAGEFTIQFTPSTNTTGDERKRVVKFEDVAAVETKVANIALNDNNCSPVASADPKPVGMHVDSDGTMSYKTASGATLIADKTAASIRQKCIDELAMTKSDAPDSAKVAKPHPIIIPTPEECAELPFVNMMEMAILFERDQDKFEKFIRFMYEYEAMVAGSSVVYAYLGGKFPSGDESPNDIDIYISKYKWDQRTFDENIEVIKGIFGGYVSKVRKIPMGWLQYVKDKPADHPKFRHMTGIVNIYGIEMIGMLKLQIIVLDFVEQIKTVDIYDLSCCQMLWSPYIGFLVPRQSKRITESILKGEMFVVMPDSYTERRIKKYEARGFKLVGGYIPPATSSK